MYRLLALKNNDSNTAIAEQEQFYQITNDYILLFTETENIDGAVEIKDNDITRLTETDKQWLADSFTTMFLSKHEYIDNFKDETNKQLEALEKALKAESDKLRSGSIKDDDRESQP